MVEIEKAFLYLQEGIPQWLQDISRVEEKVAAMQEGMVRITTSVSPFGKQRTESMESPRPDRLDAIAEDSAPSQGAQTDPAGTRKRKTLSLLSGPASGPARFRRTMVVTSYDGDMQKALELMVRAIGTGRNLLRKAKMEAKLQALAALDDSSEEEKTDVDDDDASTPDVRYQTRMHSMRIRVAARRVGSHVGTAPVTLFDTMDKSLEHSQSLCEKAAHLTLRDGDCRKELEGTRKSLVDVLQTATTEAAKCAASNSREPPLATHDTSDTSISSVEPPSYKRKLPQRTSPPPASQAEDALPPDSTAEVPTSTKPTIIEADGDDSEEEEEFVMPAVRLTSRYRSRA